MRLSFSSADKPAIAGLFVMDSKRSYIRLANPAALPM